jgi:cobalt-zinc-cadmium efflux system membrane fusion protein
LQSPDGANTADITLTSFLPSATGSNQTRLIRVSLDNRDGHWTPGLRVLATVKLPPLDVPIAVRTAGLQSFRDFTVVFAQVGETYEVRMLDLGRTDGDLIEVLGGLDAGELYVSANSFLIKADAMKAGASHDH